jgi:hypothetical protein
MFVAQTKKGAMAWNIILFMVITLVVVLVALALTKVKPDPKEPGSFRHTLGLGKKK